MIVCSVHVYLLIVRVIWLAFLSVPIVMVIACNQLGTVVVSGHAGVIALGVEPAGWQYWQ